jgi:hypothetical protein
MDFCARRDSQAQLITMTGLVRLAGIPVARASESGRGRTLEQRKNLGVERLRC